MSIEKKRIIKGLDSLPKNVFNLIEIQYPNGYTGGIKRIENAKKEPIFVFPLETEEAIYLVKVPVVKKNNGEYKIGNRSKDFETDDDDDDQDSFGENDPYDDNNNDVGDSEKEASYEPDFDK